MRKEIAIYWFKRDLRLEDNEALAASLASGFPVLFVYLLEPSLQNDAHYSKRHFDFIKETLKELSISLAKVEITLFCLQTEVIPFLELLQCEFVIKQLFSTEETGLQITYHRDKLVKKFCRNNEIEWVEFQNNGVIRGRKNREKWRTLFYSYMGKDIHRLNWDEAKLISTVNMEQINKLVPHFSLHTEEHSFQKGGRTEALVWMDSFFTERIAYYSAYISKPEMSRYGCSRLSAYIAWGVISIREIYQFTQEFKKSSTYKKQASAFSSRLRWQSHFIQKFEMEMRMEKEAVNKGYIEMPYVLNENFVEAWKYGNTGYPLVDAAMRCVIETGYINFRMRAMVTSFLTHHLFQHFTTGSAWLAQQFLDFEPGIHYGQFQMQAGLTGINTVRVYNPTKNALDHDEEAVFIKKYVPELRNLPKAFAIEPWKMTKMEELLYDFDYGNSYPKRIVDIAVTRKEALEKIYGQRKRTETQKESKRVLDKHTLHKTESRFP